MQGRVNASAVIAALGALGILVGLSLEWFDPQISGWTAFEIVDLILAAIAIGVVAAILGAPVERPGADAARRWLPVAAAGALVLVLASIVNHPPMGDGRSLEVGAWVSLAGAALLLAGTVLATTSVAVVVTMRPLERERERDRAAPEPDTDEEEVLPGAEPAATDEGVVPAEEGSETETRPLRSDR